MSKLIEGLKEMARLEEARIKEFGYSPEELVRLIKKAAKKLLEGCEEFENEKRDAEISHDQDERMHIQLEKSENREE